LEASLLRLAEIMESKARIRRRVRAASMYPIVALIVAILVVSVIMVVAIPTFASVYSATQAELPGVTRALIGISNFMVSYWWLLLILVAAVVIGLAIWKKTPAGNHVFSWIGMRTPGLGAVTRKIAVARSCRTL